MGHGADAGGVSRFSYLKRIHENKVDGGLPLQKCRIQEQRRGKWWMMDDGVAAVTQTLHSANPAEKSGSDLGGAVDTARRMEQYQEPAVALCKYMESLL